MRCFAPSRTLSICERGTAHADHDQLPNQLQITHRGASADDGDNTHSVLEQDQMETTWIVNQTRHTILFRDKYKKQFGRLRHSIPPDAAHRVAPDIMGTVTYYQMGVLATANTGSGHEGNTNIVVDSDDLAVYDRIVVSSRRNGKFVMDKRKRKRSNVSNSRA